jgi:hypothetical protein
LGQRYETVLYNNRLQAYDMRLGTASSGSDLWRLQNDYHAGHNNGNVVKQYITLPTSSGTPPTVTIPQVYTYDGVNRLRMAEETRTAPWY